MFFIHVGFATDRRAGVMLAERRAHRGRVLSCFLASAVLRARVYNTQLCEGLSHSSATFAWQHIGILFSMFLFRLSNNNVKCSFLVELR